MKMKRIIKHIPIWAWVSYSLALAALVVHIAAQYSTSFSDFFNRYISAALRAVFAYITCWFPFSLAEVTLLSIPLIVAVLAMIGRRAARSNTATLRFCASILAIVTLFYSAFVFNFGVAYHCTPLEDRLSLHRAPLSAEELYETGEWIVGEVNQLSGEIAYESGGFSVMPYSISKMNSKLMQAYDAACERYDFIQGLYSTTKPVMLSRAMSYTHITGIYSYYTGEANINVDFPDYSVVFTAAHELAHQRGIAREDEANFVAFLVLKDAGDPYLRYCAYVNMFEYVGNSLYSASPELYFKLYRELDSGVIGELTAYGRFFERYADSKASEVSGAINDTYLKLQGTQGSVSYGLVTDLAAAYFKSEIKGNR